MEDEMIGWRHCLNGHEFEQALGDREGHGSLACCSSWGHKKSDLTEQLNDNNKACKLSFWTKKFFTGVWQLETFFLKI